MQLDVLENEIALHVGSCKVHVGINMLTGGMSENNRTPRVKKRRLHGELVQEGGI